MVDKIHRDMDAIMAAAGEAGQLGFFNIDSVSYRPVHSVANTICRWVYRVPLHEDYTTSPRYRREKAAGREELCPDPERPFDAAEVTGTFLFLSNQEQHQGILHLTEVVYKPELRISLRRVPHTSLFPYRHTVTRVDVPSSEDGSAASFFTTDHNGSEWVLHCSPGK